MGQNGHSKLYELVDLGVGLLIEKDNKKKFKKPDQISACYTTNLMVEK